MKARVLMTESQIRKIVKKESEIQTTKIYDAAVKDATYQAFAVCFIVLAKEFGFGAGRLGKLKNSIEAEYVSMCTGILGKPYGIDDVIKYLKEHYGIDFNESCYSEAWDKKLRR